MPSSNSKHSNSNSSSNKKQSKSNSKSRSQSSFPDAATPPRTTTAAEPQQLTSLIQQASQIFPSFISQSAFIAEITDIDTTNSASKGAKIWLSEPFMVASSLAPGSLV
ncbi:calmodulin-interacting protein 111-like protein, partial [Trifolium pratense]